MNNEKDLNKLSEQIKKSSNILVAVNSDPSIDELTSALALTLMLNKNARRAVTIYSGKTPNVLRFLKLEETFNKTVDGLRDFIITLASNKADRVIVKAEEDVVKVYVTPSGKSISSKDLGFEQGDYNVDLVIGVGVSHKDDLDKALSAHGRILHNASVASLSIGKDSSDLGGLNIKAPRASSYAEIIYLLPELLDNNLGEDEDPAMDKAVATALLTSLVAATNRFSNNRTTAEIMSLASDLMRAGANQQLVAKELEKGGVVEVKDDADDEPKDKSSQPTINVRPESNNSKTGSINLKPTRNPEKIIEDSTQKERSRTNKKPSTSLPSIDTVEIEPNFANLEEYNEEQLSVERQSTADEVLSKLSINKTKTQSVPPVVPPIVEPISTEDDKLAQQLQQVNKTPDLLAVETANTQIQEVAKPDPTIVFGKEEAQPYLQDPSYAWRDQVSGLPTSETPSQINSSDSQHAAPLPGTPSMPLSDSQNFASSDASQPAMPPIPDFSAMNVAPPLPPTPPDFTMPPNLADITQQAVASQQQFNSGANQPVGNQAGAPESPQYPPIIPTGRYQPTAMSVPTTTSPVMTDQVYSQPIDNAQFVLPE